MTDADTTTTDTEWTPAEAVDSSPDAPPADDDPSPPTPTMLVPGVWDAAMLAALTDAAAHADVILTSGGISMGDYEVVRESLEPLGAVVGHVAMQPGGPQATAVFDGVPVICFPGNPVSTQLSFEVFVAPVIRSLSGHPQARRSTRAINDSLRSIEGKRQFLRGCIEGQSVTPVSGPGSHLVAGLAAADCLIVIPESVASVTIGESVEVWEL